MSETNLASTEPESHGDAAELARRIDGIRFAMVTLPGPDGALRGRPLTVQDVEFDGTFWFMVSTASGWTSGLGSSCPANVAFSDPDSQRWVSIAGTAALVHDAERIDDMWNPLYEAWFRGRDDPDITLLRVDSTTADYWDADANRIVRWARIAKAAVTGGEPDEGDRGTLHPR